MVNFLLVPSFNGYLVKFIGYMVLLLLIRSIFAGPTADHISDVYCFRSVLPESEEAEV